MEVLIVVCVIVVPVLGFLLLRSATNKATQESEAIEAQGGVPCGVSCGLVLTFIVVTALVGMTMYIGSQLPVTP